MNSSTEQTVHIDVWLTQQEYEMLRLMCGYQTGRAASVPSMKWSFLHIVNRLFEKMPNFTKYEIPPEFAWKEKDDDDTDDSRRT